MAPKKPTGKRNGVHELPDPGSAKVSEWVAKQVEALMEAKDPKQIRAAVGDLDLALDRFALEMDRALTPVRLAVQKLTALTGPPEPAATGDELDLSILPVNEDTIITVSVGRRLSDYFEKAAISKELMQVFANKTPRRQGSGWSDIVTLRGHEIHAFLRMLYAHRSKSGWYTLVTKVIVDTEEQIRRQKKKGPATRR